MIWQALQKQTRFLGYISGLSCVVLIFLLTLSGCPQGLFSTNRDNTKQETTNPNFQESPAGVPTPPSAQTEYVFHNKTNSQISILADQGDDRGVSKVVLNAGECVYIEYLPFSLAYAKFIKAGKTKPLCGNPCDDDPHKRCEYEKCSDKLQASQRADSYNNFERDRESKVGYLEVYNMVDANHLFETVGLPVLADSSQKDHWKGQCQSSSKGQSNSPPKKTGS